MHPQRRRDVLRVLARRDRVDRPKPHLLQRRVIQLPTVVVADKTLSQKKPRKVDLLTCVLV